MADGGCRSGCGVLAVIILVLIAVFFLKIIAFLTFVWVTANLPT